MTHVQNDAYTMWVNTIWACTDSWKKGALIKMSSYISLGTPTCIKEESKSSTLGLSLYQTGYWLLTYAKHT